MLDAFIIEEIKRQEQERRREEQRPSLPLEDDDFGRPARQGGEKDEVERGVIIIDYSI